MFLRPLAVKGTAYSLVAAMFLFGVHQASTLHSATVQVSAKSANQPAVSRQVLGAYTANAQTSSAEQSSPSHLSEDEQFIRAQSVQPSADLVALIDGQLDTYLAQGKFIGPQGPVGPQGPSGSAAAQLSVPVSYFQGSPSSNAAGSIAGVTELSAQDFTTNTATISNTLTVNGTTNFTGPVIYSGNTSYSGTTTFATLGVGAPAVSGTSVNVASGTATGGTGYGLKVAAPSGATNNYAAVFSGGNVGIGTSTPSSTLQVAGSIAGVKVSAPFYGTYSSYDAFGDSITGGGTCACGYSVTQPANSYVNRISTALGLPVTNHGISGTQAPEQATYIYPTNVSATGSQLFTLLIGTNDASKYWTDVNKQTNFTLFDLADMAYLAIPSQNKTLGQSSGVTYGGSWSNSSYYGGSISKQSSTNGSTASFSAYGPVVYLAYTMQDGSGGQFSVAVDGTTIGTYNSTGTNGAAISTNLGATYGSALLRITGLAYAQHTVTMTVTSATSASNVVWFDWGAGAAGNSYSGGPTVIVGGVPRSLNLSDTVTQTYTSLVKRNISLLAGDGLNVAYADVPAYLNTSTDFISDGTHPNDLGHLHVSDAFLAVINTGSTSSAKQGSLSGNVLGAALFAGPTGNIGIGTTAPTAALDVKSDTGVVLETTTTQSNSAGGYLLTLRNGRHAGGGGSTDTINFDQEVNNGTIATYAQLQSAVWANTNGSQSGSFNISTVVAGSLAPRIAINSSGNTGINGGLSVGATYYTTAAPTNGAIIQGSVGIGTSAPSVALDVKSDLGVTFESATNNSNSSGDYLLTLQNGRLAGGGGSTDTIAFNADVSGGTAATYAQLQSGVQSNALGGQSGSFTISTAIAGMS